MLFLYVIISLLPVLSIRGDCIVLMDLNLISLIIFLLFVFYVFLVLFCFIQCVPLATEPGISSIILTQMKILQRNLNRITFVV